MKTKLRICFLPLLITFLTIALLLWKSSDTDSILGKVNFVKHYRKRPDRIRSILDRYAGPKLDSITARENYMRVLVPMEVNRDFTPNLEYIEHPVSTQECNLISCFNFSRCLTGFSVYVYPPSPDLKITPLFAKILRTIKESPYYTTDPHSACLLIPPYDTLDRDTLSSDYENRFRDKLTTLPHWNLGLNHLVFNFFSGTSPFYSHSLSSLNLNFGKSILVKASLSASYYRRDFDVSSPLIPKDFKFTNPNTAASENLFKARRKYKLTFKGKRYLWGIGSLIRNALFNIDNSDDVILLTTCVHGRYWFKMQDKRCESDNKRYGEFDYNELMLNSSFCLVPRGRRLGSFRFLESLQAACLPVSLSNGFISPFSEVIDWRLAGLSMDERHFLQVPLEMRSIPDSKMLSMQVHSHFLWKSYLSSTSKFVHTVLEILRDRIYPHSARNYSHWNFPPGALYTEMEFSRNLVLGKFTIVVRLENVDTVNLEKIWRLIKCESLFELILVLNESISELEYLREKSDNIRIVISNDTFLASHFFKTEALLNLNFDSIPTSDQIEFVFSVWKEFPERLVGFRTLSHLSSRIRHRGKYNPPVFPNSFSFISPFSAFYHTKYNSDYSKYIPHNSLSMATESQECKSIGLIFYISHLTHSPPIKIAEFPTLTVSKNNLNTSLLKSCLDLYLELYGYNPLIESGIQFVPLSQLV